MRKVKKMIKQKNKKELSKIKIRIWCTKCDVDMIESSLAMDCPDNGIFYVCPNCNYRIIVF